MKNSLGIIETVGLTGAIRAADIMVKCAYVEVLKIEFIGCGLVSVIISGDIESVKSALEVGAEAAMNEGEVVGVHTIPRPYLKLEEILKETKDKDDINE